ncbi:hypothetical protein BX616_010049 [Lobosporangium transversale]|nr:hypothetical protein BX616_010049 [Lobosporangium transversale]
MYYSALALQTSKLILNHAIQCDAISRQQYYEAIFNPNSLTRPSPPQYHQQQHPQSLPQFSKELLERTLATPVLSDISKEHHDVIHVRQQPVRYHDPDRNPSFEECRLPSKSRMDTHYLSDRDSCHRTWDLRRMNTMSTELETKNKRIQPIKDDSPGWKFRFLKNLAQSRQTQYSAISSVHCINPYKAIESLRPSSPLPRKQHPHPNLHSHSLPLPTPPPPACIPTMESSLFTVLLLWPSSSINYEASKQAPDAGLDPVGQYSQHIISVDRIDDHVNTVDQMGIASDSLNGHINTSTTSTAIIATSINRCTTTKRSAQISFMGDSKLHGRVEWAQSSNPTKCVKGCEQEDGVDLRKDSIYDAAAAMMVAPLTEVTKKLSDMRRKLEHAEQEVRLAELTMVNAFLSHVFHLSSPPREARAGRADSSTTPLSYSKGGCYTLW